MKYYIYTILVILLLGFCLWLVEDSGLLGSISPLNQALNLPS